MSIIKKFIAILLSVQLIAFSVFANEASLKNNQVITDSDLAKHSVLKKLKESQKILRVHGTYFVDENGEEIDLISIVKEGASTIRVHTIHDNGENFGLEIRIGRLDLNNKTLKIKMGAFDPEFKTLMTAYSFTLDLKQDREEIENYVYKSSVVFSKDVGIKLTSQTKIVLNTIFGSIIPNANANYAGFIASMAFMGTTLALFAALVWELHYGAVTAQSKTKAMVLVGGLMLSFALFLLIGTLSDDKQ